MILWFWPFVAGWFARKILCESEPSSCFLPFALPAQNNVEVQRRNATPGNARGLSTRCSACGETIPLDSNLPDCPVCRAKLEWTGGAP